MQTMHKDQKQCRNGYEEVRSHDSSGLRAEGHEKSSLQRNPKSWKKPFIAEGINLDDSLSSATLQEQIWISLGRIPEHLKRGRLLGEQEVRKKTQRMDTGEAYKEEASNVSGSLTAEASLQHDTGDCVQMDVRKVLKEAEDTLEKLQQQVSICRMNINMLAEKKVNAVDT